MMAQLLASFYIFGKTLNYSASKKHKTLSILWCLALALLYAIIIPRIPWLLFLHTTITPDVSWPLVWSVYCAASIVFILVLTRLKPDAVISAFLLSFCISLVIYHVVSAIIAVVLAPFVSSDRTTDHILDYNAIFFLVLYFVISVLQLLLSYLLFQIKRFKKGFPFLLKGYAVVIALIATGSVMALLSFVRELSKTDHTSARSTLFFGMMTIGIGLFIWIKRGIKSAYLRWAKAHNEKLYEQVITEKDDEIRRLTELNDKLRSANHSIIHRLSALELGYANILERTQSGDDLSDMSEELTASLENVRRIMDDYRRDVRQSGKAKPLPSTKVKMLDDLFGLFSERCASDSVDFDLIVNGSIPYMVENIIDQSRLETMIGDLVQNAVIAVTASDNPFRSILAILGIEGECYALTVFDSGVAFDADTLIRLGEQRVTTHADAGGSGEGFIKTFETMREYNASLIISEKKPGIIGHTKSVTVRFDDKGQYIIETYRPRDYPKSDRYVVA